MQDYLMLVLQMKIMYDLKSMKLGNGLEKWPGCNEGITIKNPL